MDAMVLELAESQHFILRHPYVLFGIILTIALATRFLIYRLNRSVLHPTCPSCGETMNWFDADGVPHSEMAFEDRSIGYYECPVCGFHQTWESWRRGRAERRRS